MQRDAEQVAEQAAQLRRQAEQIAEQRAETRESERRILALQRAREHDAQRSAGGSVDYAFRRLLSALHDEDMDRAMFLLDKFEAAVVAHCPASLDATLGPAMDAVATDIVAHPDYPALSSFTVSAIFLNHEIDRLIGPCR